MTTLATDAKQMSLLLHFGALTPGQVIAWADSKIAELDELPNALLELSLTPKANLGNMVTCLNTLAVEGDFWLAFRQAMPRLYDHVASHPVDAERLANEMFSIVVRAPLDTVPRELDFIYRFAEAFNLAREGYVGNLEEVHKEFLSELQRPCSSQSLQRPRRRTRSGEPLVFTRSP